ncbi:MAG: 30S ribosomal protein S27ae [Candidatus Nanohalarchaeota archaeon]|nr:MAG: 30S ribosomal protein S27ae [Candidatus Nanohaloarchaeota archaeon]
MAKKPKSKSKHKKVEVSKKYEVVDNKIKRNFKKCPKCRNILADMKDRYYCGFCRYTEIFKRSTKE